MRIDLGPFFRSVAAFFSASAHPAITAAAPSVIQPLQQAADAAEAALPAVANDMANAALSHIPEGQLFSPVADMLIDQTVANLLAKKSTAQQPAA